MHVRSLALALCAVLVALCAWTSSAATPLNLGAAKSDAAALKLVESAAQDEETLLNAMHVGVAMDRGWWRTAKKLVTICRERGLDVSHVVHQKASSVRRHLQELMNTLAQPAASRSILPAFQWAQSKDAVFLSVKFSHRIDAPAHLDCTDDHVNVTATALHLLAPCRSGHTFELRLDFLKAVDPANSTWSLASVGRMTFTLAKATADAPWARLLRSKKKAGNMHTWWAMKEKYEEELRNSTLRAEAQTQNASTPTPAAVPAKGKEGEVTAADAAPSAEAGADSPPTAEKDEPAPAVEAAKDGGTEAAEGAETEMPRKPPGMPALAKEEL